MLSCSCAFLFFNFSVVLRSRSRFRSRFRFDFYSHARFQLFVYLIFVSHTLIFLSFSVSLSRTLSHSFPLHTGGNDFTPRPLPACFASLRNLEALFMANCHVRGPLPSWIGELTGTYTFQYQYLRFTFT